MKKIITFFFLSIAIFSSAMKVEARSMSGSRTMNSSQSSYESQNAGSREEFGPSVFFKENGEGVGEFKSNIAASLQHMGFTQKGKSFVKNGIEVCLFDDLGYLYEIKLKFDNIAERNKFLKGAKSAGYEWTGEYMEGGLPCICFFVDDNEVTIHRCCD